MINLLIAAIIAVGGWWVLRQFAASSGKQSSLLIRKLSGAGCILLAGILSLRGGIAIAVPLFAFGVGLLGWSIPMPWQQKSPGQRSQVQTSVLTMQLDHDTGRMDGEVIAGPLRGRKLSSLNEMELASLEAQCALARDQSLALFQAWLDKAKPGWRERAQQNRSRPPPSSKMDKEEALAVLGLKPGASAEDIRSAHRRLMKDFHPDRGGSDYLAAKINAAKDRALQD